MRDDDNTPIELPADPPARNGGNRMWIVVAVIAGVGLLVWNLGGGVVAAMLFEQYFPSATPWALDQAMPWSSTIPQLPALVNTEPWGLEYSTKGMQLTLSEASRDYGKSDTVVVYSLTASGLPTDQKYTLWAKSFDDPPRLLSNVSFNFFGGLILEPGHNATNFTVGNFVPGQAYWIEVRNADKSIMVFAKDIPFPIEANDGAACRLSAELVSRNGYNFEISGRGFVPGEKVKLIRTSSDNNNSDSPTQADDKGAFRIVVSGSPIGSGWAIQQAIGRGCDLTVHYNWGMAALKVQ